MRMGEIRQPMLSLRRAGLQRQRMELASHLGLERLIDDLVLLDARFAANDSAITVAA